MVAKKKAEFTIRTRQFQVNKLLNRRQFLVDILHPSWNGTVPKKTVVKKIAQMYKIGDEQTIAVFGMKSKFGGGRTTGFGLIYDDLASAKRTEPNYRLVRIGLGRKKKIARKSLKERKNRDKKIRGVKKGKAAAAPKGKK